jgi:hypothetical protein
MFFSSASGDIDKFALQRANGSGAPSWLIGPRAGSFLRGPHCAVRTSGGSLEVTPAGPLYETRDEITIVVAVIGPTTTTVYGGFPGQPPIAVLTGSTPSGNFYYEYDAGVWRSVTLGVGYDQSGDTLTAGSAFREWSEAEVVSYFGNPWQIFRAPSRRLWVVPSGAATYDIAGDTVGEGATTGEISVIGAVSIAGATSGEGVTAGAITFTLPSFSIAGDTVGEGATTGAITTSAPTYDIAGVTTGEGVSTGEISVSVAYSIAGDTVGEGATTGGISLAGTYDIAGATVGEGVTTGAIEVPAVYFLAADTVGEGVTAGSIEIAGTYSLEAATEGEGVTTGAISILATYSIAGATAGVGSSTGAISLDGEVIWYRTGPNFATKRRAARNVKLRR